MEFLIFVFLIWLVARADEGLEELSRKISNLQSEIRTLEQDSDDGSPTFWYGLYNGQERRFKKTWEDPHDNE